MTQFIQTPDNKWTHVSKIVDIVEMKEKYHITFENADKNFSVYKDTELAKFLETLFFRE